MSSSFLPVPHLTTANSHPLHQLEKIMLDKQVDIETWFRPEWHKTPAPITSSVDLRNAGFKIAPVDTNLFPAGFNNLNPEFHALCIQATQSIIFESMPGCKKIMLVPENHTRNPFYYESLYVLFDILKHAGFQVKIGSLRDDVNEPMVVKTVQGHELTIYPTTKVNNRLCIGDFNPCLILLNNDLSEGIPDKLQNLHQWIRPSEQLGWANRLKSNHFHQYQQVAQAFCTELNIEPWLITPLYTNHAHIDFKTHEGEQQLAEAVDGLLADIQQRYELYKIKQRPFVVVKADAGTYGMGVMMVHSGSELLSLNRKQRNKMSRGKGNKKIEQVIIQEGVPTFESWQTNDAVAEPVVYMIGHHVIGGFYRVHTGRGPDENLNAPGMHFEPLAFAKPCNYPQADDCQNRFYVYGVIARLAALAAARELHALAIADLEK